MRLEAVNLRIGCDSGGYGQVLCFTFSVQAFMLMFDPQCQRRRACARIMYKQRAEHEQACEYLQGLLLGLRSRESNYVRVGCGRCPGEAGTTLAPLPRAGGLRAILVSSPARPGRRRPTVHTGSIPDQRRSCDCMRCRHRLPRRTSKETIILPLYETSEQAH